MKIKTFIVMLVAASFFMTLFYAENVRGATSTYTCGFELGTLNNPYTVDLDGVLYSKYLAGTEFEVDNVNVRTGTKSFHSHLANGWLNFTTGNGLFINDKISFWSDSFTTGAGNQWYYIGFFNQTYVNSHLPFSLTDDCIILLFYTVNDDALKYYDHNSVYQTAKSTISWGSWMQTNITINDYDNITYQHQTATKYGTPHNVTQLQLNYTIDSIYIGSMVNMYTSIDDMSISYTTTTGGISTGDLSEYTGICTGGATGSTVNVENFVQLKRTIGWCPFCWTENYYEYFTTKYLENQFISPISRTIYAVDLFVSGEQLTYVSDSTADYQMTLNGISWGTPDFILPYESGYTLRWINTFGTKLTNEKPLFEFYSEKADTSGKHWRAVYLSGSNAWTLSKYHGTDDYYGNNDFDGYTLSGGKISMCYYYNASLSAPPCENCEVWMENFTQKFGNDFIQFLHYDETCYYGLDYNKNPIIIYNLSDIYLETGSRCFLMEIIKVGEGTPVYFKNINIPDNEDFIQGIETITDYTFTETGQYYIKLWNTTEYCGSYNSSNLIGNGGNPSMPITVCQETSNPPPESGGISGGIGNFDFSGLPVFFRLIAALFIIIALTITPYALALLLSRGNIEVQMPSLIYVAFFFIGMVASIMLGFLDTWVFFVVLLGLIIVFAVLWIQKKGGGEQ